MKEFLTSLNYGLSCDKIKPNFKALSRELLNLSVVKLYKNKLYLNNGFVFGKMDISSKGVGFLQSFDEKHKVDFLIENKDLNGANYGDFVVCKIIKSRKKRACAKVLLVLKRASKTSLLITKAFGKNVLAINLKTGLTVPVKASAKSLKALPLGTVLRAENDSKEIIEVVGHIDDEMIDEKISLALFDKNDEFSEQCLSEAKANGDFVDISMYENRKDLRTLNFCTIDPIDAKDFDDAIFYDSKKRQLFVAIADVSEYVYAYSALDKEALHRGFSIYFPHKAVPMLPRVLSENICSLKPNEDRLAFVFKISFDENFTVLNEELFEAVINSKRRFNYDELDVFLEQGGDLNACNWLYELYELTKITRKQRLLNAFEFRTKELRLGLDEKHNIISTRYESDTASHNLVEDCMLFANKAAAKLINVGVFRNHGAMDVAKMKKLALQLISIGIDVKVKTNLREYIKDVQSLAAELNLRDEVDKLIIKAQKKAVYASENEGHFGLGFEKYTHFTSPIRRYSDLLLHRLLKAKLKNDEKLFSYLLLDIKSTCENLSILEREADKVALDFMDRKFARWAKKNIGKEVRAVVSEVSNICVAKLDDELKGANLYLRENKLALFEKILVQIVDVDIIYAKIFVKFVKRLEVENV